MLGRFGIRAHQAEHHVGVMRARGPYLLTVDYEFVADDLGARRNAARSEPAPGSE